MVDVTIAWATSGRLVQFSSFLGRHLPQNVFAFTQAEPLQGPVLLQLRHVMFCANCHDIIISDIICPGGVHARALIYCTIIIRQIFMIQLQHRSYRI